MFNIAIISHKVVAYIPLKSFMVFSFAFALNFFDWHWWSQERQKQDTTVTSVQVNHLWEWWTKNFTFWLLEVLWIYSFRVVWTLGIKDENYKIVNSWCWWVHPLPLKKKMRKLYIIPQERFSQHKFVPHSPRSAVQLFILETNKGKFKLQMLIYIALWENSL